MKTRDLVKLGIPAGRCTDAAQRLLQATQTSKGSTRAVLDDLRRLAEAPEAFLTHDRYRDLAQALIDTRAAGRRYRPRDVDAPYRIWGEGLEPDAVRQMTNACRLPVAAAGALMPDAHVGYGLPIGCCPNGKTRTSGNIETAHGRPPVCPTPGGIVRFPRKKPLPAVGFRRSPRAVRGAP